MNNETNNPESDDKVLAMLGLLAQTGQACGQVPDDKELRAYLRGECSPERSDEIRTHIANDPDIADRVIALSESEETVVDASTRFNRRRLANRWTAFAGVSALAASVLVAVFMIQPATNDPASPGIRIVRTDTTNLSSERQQELDAIRLGYASGSASSGASGFGNALVADCSQNCSERQKLRQYGALLNNLEKSCSATNRATPDARTSLQALASGPGAMVSSPWRGYVMDLKRASEQSDTALCRVALEMTKFLKTD